MSKTVSISRLLWPLRPNRVAVAVSDFGDRRSKRRDRRGHDHSPLGTEAVSIVSLRQANKKERKLYGSQNRPPFIRLIRTTPKRIGTKYPTIQSGPRKISRRLSHFPRSCQRRRPQYVGADQRGRKKPSQSGWIWIWLKSPDHPAPVGSLGSMTCFENTLKKSNWLTVFPRPLVSAGRTARTGLPERHRTIDCYRARYGKAARGRLLSYRANFALIS